MNRHSFYDRYSRDENTKQFYQSKAWREIREVRLARDNFLCQRCLERKRFTQADTVHHIIELRCAPSRALDINNLVSLCAACHNEIHNQSQNEKKIPNGVRIIKA